MLRFTAGASLASAWQREPSRRGYNRRDRMGRSWPCIREEAHCRAEQGNQPDDDYQYRPPRLGRRVRQVDTGGQRVTGARAPTQERDALTQLMLGRGDLHRAEPGYVPELLPAPLASVGRGSRRARHVHLHAEQGRRGPQQQLDGPVRSASQDRCAVRRRHEGPHDVRRALLHGADRVAVFTLRRRDHRQPIRRAEHAHHDAHGHAGAAAHRT